MLKERIQKGYDRERLMDLNRQIGLLRNQLATLEQEREIMLASLDEESAFGNLDHPGYGRLEAALSE